MQIEELIRYAFAVRLPFLRRTVSKKVLSDKDIKALYNSVSEFGISNPDCLIELDFKRAFKIAKSRQPEPFFNGEWFRKWIYSHGNNISAINNRNMFFLGCADALLPLYYSALHEKLSTMEWTNR